MGRFAESEFRFLPSFKETKPRNPFPYEEFLFYGYHHFITLKGLMGMFLIMLIHVYPVTVDL